MTRYKFVVAYDGTDYAGWQYQPQVQSVTNILQDTFYSSFHKYIKIIGASRTDAGVHALSQVGSFETDLDVPAQQMLKVWNNRLPDAI